MKYFKTGLFLLLSFLPTLACAEMEKIARDEGAHIHLYWWPNVNPPEGWVQDKASSFHYTSKAFAPVGHTFNNAETVIYAKANYKPQEPETRSLEDLIQRDKEDFLARDKSIEVKEAVTIKSKDGKTYLSYYFFPKAGGNWERVSYGEEGEYYLTFAISARSEAGLKSHEKSYIQMIENYKQ